MISEDQDITGVNNASTRNTSAEYLRKMPSIASNFTNPKSVSLKAEFSKQIGDLASSQDDPVYLELYGKFHDAILYDNETRASQKLFRVRAVQFVQSYTSTSTRLSCWEATCKPIYRDVATCKFMVPHALMVEGSSVIETNALVGYALAEYADGIDGEPTYLPWLENYINHFRNVIAPTYERVQVQDLLSSEGTTASPSPARKGYAKDLPSSAKTSRPPSRPRKRTKISSSN
jgi:hypothetical protein